MTSREAYLIMKNSCIGNTKVTQGADLNDKFYIFNTKNPDVPYTRYLNTWFAVNKSTKEVVPYYPFENLFEFTLAMEQRPVNVNL